MLACNNISFHNNLNMNRDRRPHKPAHELTAAELKKISEDEKAWIFCEDIEKAMQTVVSLLQSPHKQELWDALNIANSWIGPESLVIRNFDIGIEVPEGMDCYLSRNWSELDEEVPRSPNKFVAEFLELIVFEWEGGVLVGDIVFGNRSTDKYLVFHVTSNADSTRLNELVIEPVIKSQGQN